MYEYRVLFQPWKRLFLELLFHVHLAYASVPVLEFLYARHHGGVHAAELGTPLVESWRVRC